MILDGAIIAAIGQVVAEGVLSLVRHASNVRDRRQSENLVVAVDDSIEEAMRRMQSLMTAGKTAEITAHSASDLARFMRSPEAVQSLEALLGIMLSGGQTGNTSLWYQTNQSLLHCWIEEPEDVPTIARYLHSLYLAVLAHPVDNLRGTRAAPLAADELQVRSEGILQHLATTAGDLGGYRAHVQFTEDFDELRKAAFEDLTRIRPAPDAAARYIDLDEIYVVPSFHAYNHLNSAESQPPYTLDAVLRLGDRFVIVGDPGAGKTTLARHLTRELNREGDGANTRVGIIITLRHLDLSATGSTPRLMAEATREISALRQAQTEPAYVEWLASTGRLVLFCDGLDELIHPSDRAKVVTEIHRFAARYPHVPIIATSRRVGYDEAPLDSTVFSAFQVAPFDTQQTEEYVQRWFNQQSELAPSQREGSAKALMAESHHVKDLISNPLLLSLICLLYRASGYIPSNRPEVYGRCADLLFYEWDQSRKIEEANLVLTLATRKHILEDIAHWCLSDSSILANGISTEQLENRISQYLASSRGMSIADAEGQASAFVAHATGRAWVFTDVGSDLRSHRYEFTHRTFLEYFAACYLVSASEGVSNLTSEILAALEDSSSGLVPELALLIFDARSPGGCSPLVSEMLSTVSSAEDDELIAKTLHLLFGNVENLLLEARAQAMLASTTARLFAERTADIFPDAEEIAAQIAQAMRNSINSVQRSQLAAVLRRLLEESDPVVSEDLAWLLYSNSVDLESFDLPSIEAWPVRSGRPTSAIAIVQACHAERAAEAPQTGIPFLLMPAMVEPVDRILLPPFLASVNVGGAAHRIAIESDESAFIPDATAPGWDWITDSIVDVALSEETIEIQRSAYYSSFAPMLELYIEFYADGRWEELSDGLPMHRNDLRHSALLFTQIELHVALTNTIEINLAGVGSGTDWTSLIQRPLVPELNLSSSDSRVLYWSAIARRVGAVDQFLAAVEGVEEGLAGPDHWALIARRSPMLIAT